MKIEMISLKFLISVVLLYLFFPEASLGNKTAVFCGQQQFTSDSGGYVSFSPVYDTSLKDCSYDIKVSRGRRVVLTWKELKIDGSMPLCVDSGVTVYIGCSKKKVSVFCSKNMDTLPHKIYSRDNCMSIVLHSTQAAKERFQASYETYPADQPISSSLTCASQKYLYKKADIIYSPKWPVGLKTYYESCEWDIKVPMDHVIKMNFMDVDLYKSSFYSCSNSRGRLKLKGEKSVLTSYKNKEYFCGTLNPFSKTTRYYELELEYKSKYSLNIQRGFLVGYVAYKTPETISAAKSQSKLAYIGLAIAVVVLVSCCIFFVWRRRKRQQEANRANYHSPPTQEPATTVISQQKTVSYGSGPPPAGIPLSDAPPAYSMAVSQAPYQGYPAQQYAPAPYPGAAAPYPGAAASYPGAAAPYPGAAAPYPAGSAPYPQTSAPGAAYPATESYSKSDAPPSANPTAPQQEGIPYPQGGAPPYPTK